MLNEGHIIRSVDAIVINYLFIGKNREIMSMYKKNFEDISMVVSDYLRDF